VNSVNYMQRTPLHLGSIRGHLGVVKLLIQNNADLNAVDMDFNCPLHYAAEYGHSELVAYILTQGPKFDIKNRMERTPAEVAASIEISELFKEYSHFK